MQHSSRRSAGERINDRYAGFREIGVVARNNGQIVDKSGGGDEAVFDRH